MFTNHPLRLFVSYPCTSKYPTEVLHMYRPLFIQKWKRAQLLLFHSFPGESWENKPWKRLVPGDSWSFVSKVQSTNIIPDRPTSTHAIALARPLEARTSPINLSWLCTVPSADYSSMEKGRAAYPDLAAIGLHHESKSSKEPFGRNSKRWGK